MDWFKMLNVLSVLLLSISSAFGAQITDATDRFDAESSYGIKAASQLNIRRSGRKYELQIDDDFERKIDQKYDLQYLMYPENQDIHVRFASDYSNPIIVTYTLKNYPQKSICGVGMFHPNEDENDESYQQANEEWDIDEFYTQARSTVEPNERVALVFTPPDCGCWEFELTLLESETENSAVENRTVKFCYKERPRVNYISSEEEEEYEYEDDTDTMWDDETMMSDEPMMDMPRFEALTGINPNSNSSETNKTMDATIARQEKRKERRQNLRKQARKNAKNRHRNSKKDAAVAGEETDESKMTPGSKNWKKWVQKQKKRVKNNKNARKEKKQRRRKNGKKRNRGESMEKKPSMINGTNSEFGNSTTDFPQGDAANDEEDGAEERAVNEFLGIVEPENGKEMTTEMPKEILEEEIKNGTAMDKNALRKLRKNRRMERKKARKAKKGQNKRVTQGERLCCKQGIQDKKMFIFLKTHEQNPDGICNNTSSELKILSQHKFSTPEEVCHLRYTQCCHQFTLEWLDNWKEKKALRKQQRKSRRKSNKKARKERKNKETTPTEFN